MALNRSSSFLGTGPMVCLPLADHFGVTAGDLGVDLVAQTGGGETPWTSTPPGKLRREIRGARARRRCAVSHRHPRSGPVRVDVLGQEVELEQRAGNRRSKRRFTSTAPRAGAVTPAGATYSSSGKERLSRMSAARAPVITSQFFVAPWSTSANDLRRMSRGLPSERLRMTSIASSVNGLIDPRSSGSLREASR